jgi:hypothetical protein
MDYIQTIAYTRGLILDCLVCAAPDFSAGSANPFPHFLMVPNPLRRVCLGQEIAAKFNPKPVCAGRKP